VEASTSWSLSLFNLRNNHIKVSYSQSNGWIEGEYTLIGTLGRIRRTWERLWATECKSTVPFLLFLPFLLPKQHSMVLGWNYMSLHKRVIHYLFLSTQFKLLSIAQKLNWSASFQTPPNDTEKRWLFRTYRDAVALQTKAVVSTATGPMRKLWAKLRLHPIPPPYGSFFTLITDASGHIRTGERPSFSSMQELCKQELAAGLTRFSNYSRLLTSSIGELGLKKDLL